MALRAVADHPKLSRLKSLLKCGRGEAMGYLEALWHFTGRFTPQGNIGKYSDAEIEAWIEWRGEGGNLMAAFIESGWIDTNQSHRLLVHDWQDHADDATKLALKRKKVGFISVVVTVSPQCPDTIPTPSRLPVPGPVPEPEPVPGVTGASAPPPQTPDALFADDEEQNIPDDLPAAMMGNFLLQRLSIPHSHGLAMKFADCVGLIARDERLPRGAAALQLLVRGRDHPPDSGKWRFWLEDGSWKEQVAQGISTEGWE